MESHLRLGNVPAHIAHPIAAAMMAAPVAMEVDAAAPVVADVDMGGAPHRPRPGRTVEMVAADKAELLRLLTPEPDMNGDERKIAGLPALTREQKNAQQSLTTAGANPLHLASGNKVMRLRTIEAMKLPRNRR